MQKTKAKKEKELLELKPSFFENSSFQEKPIRIVQGLIFAELCSPVFPPSKFEGLKELGLRYERSVLKRVKRWFKNETILHNPWIRFRDSAGNGFACPDIIALDSGIIFECKLSFRESAISQISDLYLPLCERVFQKPFKRIIICKHWKGKAPSEAFPFLEIISHPRDVKDFAIMIWSS
jgi:hypothetical protein